MRKFYRFHQLLSGLTAALARFPLTSVSLLAAVIVNAIDIHKGSADYSKYLLSLVVGAFLGAVVQLVHERFFIKSSSRFMLTGAAALLTLLYYFTLRSAAALSTEAGIRTLVALFALYFAFIWIPSIKSNVTFNESFMVAFKAFFIAIFFAGVIFAGISVILAAIDQLLFNVDGAAYAHTANIVFILYAPVYFLSLIPVYPGKKDQGKDEIENDSLQRISACPKFLEILISYIIIPLTSVFTVILLLYIVLNIGGRFWTDNLLEPMIVSYSIVVLLVYILASRLDNKFAAFFRKVFPKVLVPIMLFQTISSVLRTGDTGITHSRYYVILFGIFSAASGVILSFVPVRKNGIIAVMLIVFSAISIIPPTDAFTVSRKNQTALLERVLVQNNMLEGNKVKPDPSVSREDQEKIIRYMGYLDRMDYLGYIPWLPSGFDYYRDFSGTFGFGAYASNENWQYISLYLPTHSVIDIAGFDFIVMTDINSGSQSGTQEEIGIIEENGRQYSLIKKAVQDFDTLVLVNDRNEEIISFSADEIYKKFEASTSEKGVLSVEEATFNTENGLAAMRVVAQSININKGPDRIDFNGNLYVLVHIK